MPERLPFHGFTSPSYTQVPDELFDLLAPQLTEAELRVLLYIIRRTFGFKKDADPISLKQMEAGITTRDGRSLDRGTGLRRKAIIRAVKSLIDQGIIEVERRSSPEKGDEPTTYRLHFTPTPGYPKDTPPSVLGTLPPVSQGYPQQTVEQETVEQETDFEYSNIRNAQKLHENGNEPSNGQRMSLDERLAWQARMEAQEGHVKRLGGKPTG